MCKQIIRLCSMLLIMAMLINMLPVQVLGEALREVTAAPEAAPTVSQVAVKDAQIVREITENRTEFSKEFLLSNGLRVASVYSDAVHYETEDGWQEIDNTLTAKPDGTLANTAGVWQVRLPQQMSGNQAVTITKDGYRLSFAMAGELRGSTQKETRAAAAQTFTVHSAQTAAAKIEKIDHTKAKSAVQYAQIIPEKLQSRLTYSQVYQNTDVVYDLDSNSVKESIVLKQHSSTLQGYRYTLDVGKLVPVLEKDGRITFYDAKREHVVMSMPAPFLVDDAGERSTDIQVQLTGSGSAYTLTYLLPQQWLADSARVWPVILDPAVSADTTAVNIQDRRIAENRTFAYDEAILEAGRDNSYGKTRSYLKFVNLPKISASDVIVSATIQLCQPVTRTDPSMQLCVEARAVHGAWTSQGITWANKPKLDTIVEDFCLVRGTPGYYGWVITDAVRQWYSGENHGLVFKSTDANEASTDEKWMQFYSSESVYKPILTVYLRNNNGLENYWDYTATSAGRAGTGYVNNFTGNLVWVHPDIGFGGNRMPVSINHIYNANDAEENKFGLSYGWRTNYNQRVRYWYDESTQTAYYIWEDEDGTEHYFTQQDGIYKDEDGLELKLTVKSTIDRNDPQKYCIEEKNGNKSFFHDNGNLTQIQNNQQTPSSITITYTTGNKIDTITDGVGRRYVFTYTDDLLDRISYKGSGTEEISFVSFEYDEFYQLSYIWNADLDAARYAYSDWGCLSEAIDVGNYRVCYTYKSTVADYQPHRVIGIAEYDDNTAGGSLTLQYAKNQTTITDHNGNAQILQFNDFGNTISVQDDEGNAQYGTFAFNTDAEEKNNADPTKRRNQLRISSKLQNTVGNALRNTSFEAGSDWFANHSSISVTRSTEAAYLGSYSLKLVNTVETDYAGVVLPITVAAGETYTYSAYVKTLDTPVQLGLYSPTIPFEIRGEEVPANQGWRREQMTYTNTTGRTIELSACIFLTAPGTAYLDCVQLEKSNTASWFNLIDNGDFRHGTSSWLLTNLTGTDGVVGTSSPAAPTLDGNILQFAGTPDNIKHLYQRIYTSGGAGDAYVLAGWARGDSAPLNGFDSQKRDFSLVCVFHNTDGSYTERVVQFNPDAHSDSLWQYAAGAVIADKPYHTLYIDVRYDYNVNTAYFDGIQLYKEEFGNTYTYDSNGNVISVKDLQAQTTTYEYTANKLSKEILPTGAELSYVYYEGTHNVKTATTQNGLVYHFAYDTYGNNTSVSITGEDGTMRASAEYTADGNYMVSSTDTAGQTTHYSYNADTGVLEWVRYPGDPSDMRTEYTYDDIYRLREVEAHTDADNHLSANYTYTYDLLTALETASTRYSFTYGAFDQRASVEIGDRVLATYSYTDDQNRYLSELDYGNDGSVVYTYDDKGRLTQERYEDGATASYTYDNSGQLIKVTDSATNGEISYKYDTTGRLMQHTDNRSGTSQTVTYSYDELNNLTKRVQKLGSSTRTAQYTYDADNRVVGYTLGRSAKTYRYDSLGRLQQDILAYSGSELLTVTPSYITTSDGGATGLIGSYAITTPGYSRTEQYTYDEKGNILSISDGTYTTTYEYDSAGQLFRENNQAGGYTHTWIYDNAGNILCREEYPYTTGMLGTPTRTVDYGYASGWGDLLTSYNGQSITSDEIGNMLSDGTWTYTWQHGRQLATMSDGSTTWTYTYNSDGLRTERSNGTDTYSYHYVDGLLSRMRTANHVALIAHDAMGNPMTINYDGTTYFYITNPQGDVIAIVNVDGTTVVEYTYDAWGKVLSITGSKATTLGKFNPLRYRGYVYDHETGFYLTGTRYYDPEIGRFINADSVISGTGESVQGYNLFAYCFNNPVNMSDPSGNWPKWATKLVAAVAVVAVVAAVAAVTVATAGAGTAIAAVAVGAAKGAAIGFAVGAASGAAIGYATTGTLEGTLNGMADGALSGSISGAITGGVQGYSNYSNYTSARNFLKNNGQNPDEVMSCFKGTPKVKTLKTDTTVYRTWGGTTQELGHWVSPNNYGSSARNLLSLPAGNTMAHTSSFLLPKGTTVLAGKAAPLFGQSGGGVQWWISVLG